MYMDATTQVRHLRKVQDEIEMLLAGRPKDDLGSPDGYRALVLLESVLLDEAKPGRPATRGAAVCSHRHRGLVSG
jgi:hypothetical protein